AVMLDVLAAEQLLHQLDGFEKPGDAFGYLRPVSGHDMFVESFAGADTEPEAARIHRCHGGGRLGDHRWVVPEGWTGHSGADVAFSVLGGSHHERPDESGIALLRCPGLEVVRRHDARES